MSLDQKVRAKQCVNKNVNFAICIVLFAALIPGAATIILKLLEGSMAYQIGSIYNARFSRQDAQALAKHIGLGAVIGSVLAMEASILLGPFAFFIKPVIAAGVVKVLGEVITNYCEDRWGESTIEIG